MSELSPVTVRLLPSGEIRPGVELGRYGRVIELELPGEGATFPCGVLIEITTPDRVYLGEVLARKHPRMTVLVEHSVDRARVEALQESWANRKTSS